MKPTIDKTQKAIEGLPPSPLADKLTAIEKLYSEKSSFMHVGERLRLAREQVGMLALALAQAENAQTADRIQAEKYQEFIKLMGEPAHLGRFLRANWPNTFETMSEQQVTESVAGPGGTNREILRRTRLTEIAMYILTELKAGRKVN